MYSYGQRPHMDNIGLLFHVAVGTVYYGHDIPRRLHLPQDIDTLAAWPTNAMHSDTDNNLRNKRQAFRSASLLLSPLCSAT